MTRLLTSLLCVALVTMTSAWVPTVEVKACAKAKDHCCQQHETTGSHETPPMPNCPQCCLLGCALLLPDGAALAVPSTRIERWSFAHEAGTVRDERPPVPPPRWS